MLIGHGAGTTTRPFTTSIDDYGFAIDGWRPACGLDVRATWYPTTHLGLAYVAFQVVVDGLVVTCRIDPCPPAAKAPYAVVVQRDLDHEIAKAMRVANESLSVATGEPGGGGWRRGWSGRDAPTSPG